ncbi:MAG: JAB domain-containing protein [Verrucomicrobiota bacterium]
MSESSQSRPAYLREVQISYKKKRVKNGSPVGEPVSQSKQVYELFKDLENEGKEKMIAISLDASIKIISFEVVAIGSVDAIYGRPFEAIRSAIALNAVGVILVHNHPSGDPYPSQLDKNFTNDLKEITDKGGMSLYDHIIIGEDSYFSFADEGILE